MSYQRGIGAAAYATEAQLQWSAVNPVATPGASAPGSVPVGIMVGGLAVLGFLVYRHFRKGHR